MNCFHQKKYSKIIIPNVYLEDCLVSLKKLTRQRISVAYIRILLRAYEFRSMVFNENHDAMEDYLLKCYAFQEPKEGKLKIIPHSHS